MMPTVCHIYLETPQITHQMVTFRWRSSPMSTLYRQESFSLQFPSAINLTRVPQRLWWDVFFLCLHTHWLLLRPCVIHVPLYLDDTEQQFWLQLLRNHADTIEAYSSAQQFSVELKIDIISGTIKIPRTAVEGERYAAAFSGGKDSLLQAGLLAELTEYPLLVATTSPLPPLFDHQTPRRKHIFTAIQQRRHVQFIEVHSDFRSIWDNCYANQLGYKIGVSELTDTFLYMASLLICGAALGATRLFLASEAELQESVEINGRIVQNLHFMYSAATQRALTGLLKPYGITYGSLTWPLYSVQVQELLWGRYPDLCDLQYSCWRVKMDEATCSQCNQCLRICMIALASYRDPQKMGINLKKILAFAETWEPFKEVKLGDLPIHSTSRHFHVLLIDAIRRTSLLYLAFTLAKKKQSAFFSRKTLKSFQRFGQLRKHIRQTSAPQPKLGVREAFCEWLDPHLYSQLKNIYSEQFSWEPASLHYALFERSQILTARVTSILNLK